MPKASLASPEAWAQGWHMYMFSEVEQKDETLKTE